MSDALVLTGAVVKGAFAAGALAVLSKPSVKNQLGIDVTRIVAASSGAINGAYYAAAIRSGTEADAGSRLAQLWIDHATVRDAVEVNIHDLVTEQGISDAGKLVGLMRRYVRPSPTARPIDLCVVVTNADGERVDLGGRPATTFEHIFELTADDFATEGALEQVYAAVAASAALPFLYAPVPLRLGGRAIQGLDGGLVNDAPLGLALSGAHPISRVFVIVPIPRVQSEPADLHGRALASHLFDMLVHERLFRDLDEVARANRLLEQLPSLVRDPAEVEAVRAALGWAGRRPVSVVEIRPPAALPGDGFSGFWSRELREEYVRAGVAAAEAVVAEWTSAPAPSSSG
jgi:predicted acylesterase/phospholipase RssA